MVDFAKPPFDEEETKQTIKGIIKTYEEHLNPFPHHEHNQTVVISDKDFKSQVFCVQKGTDPETLKVFHISAGPALINYIIQLTMSLEPTETVLIKAIYFTPEQITDMMSQI